MVSVLLAAFVVFCAVLFGGTLALAAVGLSQLGGLAVGAAVVAALLTGREVSRERRSFV
jgi:hypothetical protein